MLLALFCGFFVNLIKKSLTTCFGDDAFKFSRENIFEISSYKSLEAVIKKFTSETGNERFAFFKEGMFNAITGQNNGED